jgi:hypothetical protein
MAPLLLRQDVSAGSPYGVEQERWDREYEQIEETMSRKITPPPNNKRNERRPRHGED